MLSVPCSLWYHRDVLRLHPHLPEHQLILMQTAPECQLPLPHHLPSQLPLVLPRIQIGFAYSHFFLQRSAAPVTAHQHVLQDLYQRSCALTIEQITWLHPALDNAPQRTDLFTDISSPPHVADTPPIALPPSQHSLDASSFPPQQSSVSSLISSQRTHPPAHSSTLQQSAAVPHPCAQMPLPRSSPQPPTLQMTSASCTRQCQPSKLPQPTATSPPPPPPRKQCATVSSHRKHKRCARAAATTETATRMQDESFGPPPLHVSTEQHLNIAYWNTNGHLTQHSAWTICQLIEHLMLDVCVLLDTRLNAKAGEYHAAAIKHFLPGSSVSLHSTTRHSTKAAGGARMQTMGGAMYILAPRCAQSLRDSHADSSGLGVAGYVTLATATDTYFISHCYLPPPPTANDGPATLNSRLRTYLDAQARLDSPQEYILAQLSTWITAARRRSFRIINGGDYNMDHMHPRGDALRAWSQTLSLTSAVHMQHPACPPCTHMLGGVPRTCIDHIFIDDLSAACLQHADAFHDALAALYSDHCPVYLALKCPGIGTRARPPAHPPPPPRMELPHHNETIVTAYQDLMIDWTAQHASIALTQQPDTAACLLGALMGATMQATATVTAKQRRLRSRVGHRSRFKDGYSPLYCALSTALRTLLALQRDLHRTRRACSSSAADWAPYVCYLKALRDWEATFRVNDYPFTQRSTFCQAAHLLTAFRLAPLQHDSIAQHVVRLRNMLHGRKRTEWRRQQSERTAKLEDMRVAQQYKQLFRSIGIKEQTRLPLDTLATADTILTAPDEIHDALTSHFAEWYRAPLDIHPLAARLHDPTWTAALLDGTALPLPDLPPTFRQQAFLNACRYRTTPEQRAHVHEITSAPLTWTEYQSEIQLLCFGKAPGPSGVTATMIKSWPLATHELAFACMCTIWQHRSTPHWWLHSLLHPIPKKGAPTLDNLRPLGLYEITRKILAAVIIKRAYRTWEHLQLLHPHQHAYRRGMGTGTAILRLLNLVEDSTESGAPLLVTAWDIKRAFDSIPHPFIRLALLRLGMDEDVTDWFLQLLSRNIVTVQSPHVQNGAMPAFPANPILFVDSPHSSSTAASFHQERGIGQGDTPSAILWVVLYDILLSMLDTPTTGASGHFLARGPQNTLYAAGSISYADDLCTPAGDLALCQLQADIVCTFCAATTLLIAVNKVLAFALNVSAPITFALHDWSWTPFDVPFSDTGVAMTYLGLDSAHHLGDAPAHSTAISLIQAGTAALRSRIASSPCKMDVIRMQLMPKLLYSAAKTCWTLREYRQLDRTLAIFLKTTSRYMHSTANALLYFPTSHGGTGMHTLSDLAQARKWSELHRALQQPGETALAAHGLLERVFRQQEYFAPSSQLRAFPAHNLKHLKCYAGSLVEWGHAAGCCLAITPSTMHNPMDAAITPHLHPQQHGALLRTLQQRDITAQGELCVG